MTKTRPAKRQKISLPRCPRCKHRGFDESKAPGDGRPQFTCQKCEFVWTAGIDGSEFKKDKTGG